MTRRDPRGLLAAAPVLPLVLSLVAPTAAIAQAPPDVAPPTKSSFKVPDPGDFVRVVYDEDGTAVRLQTAIARYRPQLTEVGEDEGVLVDLIAAVHVGDRRYYKDLDDRFRKYDAVLFELVMPEGTTPPDGQPTPVDDPFSMLVDMGLTHVGLASQTDHIDYTRDNFVHADLSPAQMFAKMEERGDDMMTIALGVLADSMRQQNQLERQAAADPATVDPFANVDPFELLFAPDGPMQMKRIFAEQLAGDAMEQGLGPTLETLLLDDRNEACMKVFQKELAKGAKRIAIFYGAAHMDDLDRRMREEFGLARTDVGWMTAWDLR